VYLHKYELSRVDGNCSNEPLHTGACEGGDPFFVVPTKKGGDWRAMSSPFLRTTLHGMGVGIGGRGVSG